MTTNPSQFKEKAKELYTNLELLWLEDDEVPFNSPKETIQLLEDVFKQIDKEAFEAGVEKGLELNGRIEKVLNSKYMSSLIEIERLKEECRKAKEKIAILEDIIEKSKDKNGF